MSDEKTEDASIAPVESTIPHVEAEPIHDSGLELLPQKLKRVIQVLRDNRGNISNTCAFFRIDRGTFYNWRKANSVFDRLVNEIQEARIDKAESRLDDLIEQGEPSAVFFMLKMHKLAQARGYVPTQQVEHQVDVKPVDIEHEKRKARQLLKDLGGETV